MQPSEGYVAGSIPAGRTKRALEPAAQAGDPSRRARGANPANTQHGAHAAPRGHVHPRLLDDRATVGAWLVTIAVGEWIVRSPALQTARTRGR